MRRCARLCGGTLARVTWSTCDDWRGRRAGIVSTDDGAVRRMDRKRKKRTSNEDWVNPHDREAEVTKMKNGATHLAYKAEQAVDLDTGVIVAITTQGGAARDTTSVEETLPAAAFAVTEQIATPTAQGQYKVYEQGMREVVTDKGQRRKFGGDERLGRAELRFRSQATTAQLEGKAEQQAAVYANQRRVESERGKRLLRRRGEMRVSQCRCDLRVGGRENDRPN